MQAQKDKEYEEEGEESMRSEENSAKTAKQSRKSKTRNYLDGVDEKHKHHFGIRNIVIGIIAASAVVVVIELMIRGIV